ncbi:hypothetical protein N9M73_03935 [Rhodobacteraceae bacterium]|nr:hypothetical protein [Paracoccaceae bacterium]MDG2295285.1 hypothetical protein [Paracoccaceae bacterium]
MSMINCMRFRPKEGQADIMFKALAKYIDEYPYENCIHYGVIDLGTGEYALFCVWETVDAFIDVMNRDLKTSELMREYVEPYEDGEAFHSFSGPDIDLTSYL